MRFLLNVIVLGTVVSCASAPRVIHNPVDLYLDLPTYRLFFSSTLSESEHPTEDLKTIPMTTPSFYVYVKWYGIPESKFLYSCEIYDGAKNLVDSGITSVPAEGSFYYTWTRHDFAPSSDVPGFWRVVIRLNDKVVIDRTVRVVIQPDASANGDLRGAI